MLNKEFLQVLKQEFERRKRVNKKYSLRAYANNLGLTPSYLSMILNGKRSISPKLLEALASKLNITETDLQYHRENISKLKSSRHVKNYDQDHSIVIDEKIFSVISDWQHYAILELLQLKNAKTTPAWIAEKLEIDVETAKKSIQNLVSVNLLKVGPKGELTATNDFTIIEDYPFSSKAMKARQKQILQLSQEKIDNIDIAFRDHSAITLPVDPVLLPKVKDKLKVFRRKLANYIVKNSKNPSEIYEIQISFFPLTSRDPKHTEN